MSTIAIVPVSTLDYSKISYGDIRTNQKGGKSVPIKYNGQPLQIRLPKMTYPMGVNVKENENGPAYTLSATLRGCDPYAKERAPTEAGEVGSLYNFLLDMQEGILETATKNSTKWFGRSRERAVLADLMKSLVSPSVEKVNGEWVASGKYPPSLKMKAPVYDGNVAMDVANFDGKPLKVTVDDDSNPSYITRVFPKRVEASIVVQPSIYVSGQGFGVTWRITYARVSPPQRLTAADVFRDEIQQEVAAPPVEYENLPSFAEEQEQVEVPVAAVAPPPLPESAPAPAPAAKNRRRVVTAA
jgi:hypothetical protein